MKTNREFLVTAILGLLLVLAAVFLRRRRGRAQPDHQPPIDI
jgi:LPXTG-motif cell wall-anchored protein